MTIEEAIKIVRGESVGYPVSCDEQINATERVADYAERYLKQKEAWEKVKTDIQKEENILYHDCEHDFSKNFDVIRVDTVLEIIDKHLSEVSE